MQYYQIHNLKYELLELYSQKNQKHIEDTKINSKFL